MPRRCAEPRWLRYDEAGKYATYLERLFATVGRDNCHVVLFEDLSKDPFGEYRRLCEFLNLEVQDEGFGIPVEEQGQLFQSFFRTSTSLDRAVQGAGLGLAVVHRAVTQMGGEVTVESPGGDGATFRVRLPRYAGLPPG